MLIGEVVGTVVATRKDEKLIGLKFQVVREVDEWDRATGRYVVAVDAVGAGHGDRVLFATGSSARQTVFTEGKPADAVILAVVEAWDVDGREVFRAQEKVLEPDGGDSK